MKRPRCLQPPKGKAADAAAAHRAPLPILTTARLVLRPATLVDFPVWEEMFLTGDFKGNSETAWDEFCVYTAAWLLHGHGLLAVEEQATGRTLGFTLLGLEWDDYEPELGWMLAPDARGQGIATEAAAALRDHATDLLGAGNFVSYIYSDNKGSRAVADRLGAVLEGHAPGEPGTLVYRHGVAP
ncbi:MAG: GNAT family N-acetyltransferase [Pseudomonadota bacterium]